MADLGDDETFKCEAFLGSVLYYQVYWINCHVSAGFFFVLLSLLLLLLQGFEVGPHSDWLRIFMDPLSLAPEVLRLQVWSTKPGKSRLCFEVILEAIRESTANLHRW